MSELKKLCIIAGSGDYPRLLVEGAKAHGIGRVDVVAVRGSTDRATKMAADAVHLIGIGEIAATIRWAAGEHYDGVILAGQVNPLSLFRSRFDATTRGWLAELKSKNAHSIFGKLIYEFERAGLKVLPASLFMEKHLPGIGALTERLPSEAEAAALKHAAKVAKDVGVHDVGQTVMVKDGMVVAVEAFEGTNAAIRRGGKLGGKGAVVFKAARVGHDMRFDIPVVGLKTLKVMKKAGATALGFQAGRLLLLEREKVLAFANRHSIAIVGYDSGLPGAPVEVEG